jgi:hypothetical protein
MRHQNRFPENVSAGDLTILWFELRTGRATDLYSRSSPWSIPVSLCLTLPRINAGISNFNYSRTDTGEFANANFEPEGFLHYRTGAALLRWHSTTLS